MLLHPGQGDVVAHQRVLRPLLLLMARDDLVHRERTLAFHLAAIDQHSRRSLVEVDEDRPARLWQPQRHPAGGLDPRVVRGLQPGAVAQAVDAGYALDRQRQSRSSGAVRRIADQ